MQSEFPNVSIITPCYNYGRFLSEALKSLLAQNYTNWECIIVNDGSSDNTEEIALKYVDLDKRFKYIYQQNKGLPCARNTALKQAQGQYIQLLDADDLLEPEKLALQVELFSSNEKVDLIYSDVLLFNNNDLNRKFVPFEFHDIIQVSGKDDVLINSLMIDNFFLPGCVIFKRNLFEQVGFFNESLYGLEDWNYWFRAALLGFEFYHDDRFGTRLLARDHESNMSKVYFKMLNARINARLHIIQISEELKSKNKLNLSQSFFKKIMLQHNIFLNKDMYEYNFHHGNKSIAFKALFRYGYYAKKPFFPIKKIFNSIFARMN